MTKTAKTCPISLADFAATAPAACYASLGQAEGADGTILVEPKEFSSGNVGLWGQGKVTVTLGGKPVPCQVGINAVLAEGTGMPLADGTTAHLLKPMLVGLYFGKPPEKGTRLDGSRKAPFKTGSYGWFVGGKVATADGLFQVGINVTVANSKPKPAANAA